MVKITNGASTFIVSKGAYDGIFSHQGFRIVDNINTNEEAENVSDVKSESPSDTVEDEEIEEDTNDDARPDWLKELMEKPIANWNKEEIKKYASEFDIDISNTKNANEARSIIKENIKASGNE